MDAHPSINMDTLPAHMKDLALDERGFPVPWFVSWIDGKPEFRAMDTQKLFKAAYESLCWVCGKKLGIQKSFVAGPMCGINRLSSEPASHYDCALWSACNCPFMANPVMVRREDERINNASFKDHAAGVALTRNPGVAMIWITRFFEEFRDDKRKPLFLLGQPERVEFYCRGRKATRAEIDASVDSGIPALEALALREPGGAEFLRRRLERFERLLPKE